MLCSQSLERANTAVIILLKKITFFFNVCTLTDIISFFLLDPGNCWLCEECHGKNEVNFILMFVRFNLLFMKSLQGVIIFIITYISIQAAS